MLIVAAVVIFALRAFGITPDSMELGYIGLACFALAFIVPSPFGMISWPNRQ